MMGDGDKIKEHSCCSGMPLQDYQNDTVSTEPMHETTVKRRRLLSPINEETVSQQPSLILPDDLIIEILVRLPVRSILQLKCVCKSWKTLISDPQFSKYHIRSTTANPSMTHQRLVYSVITHHCKILSFPVKPLFENPSTPPKAVSFRMRSKYHILGSCNGLLCLYDIHQGYVRLWNPSTRLRSKSSPTVVWLDRFITYHGFGYDHVNDEYKVLVVVDESDERVSKVYTFGTNSWRTIQNFPCTCHTKWSGKFCSGTLNWIAKGGVNDDQWVILSFDLEKETYREVLLPKQDGDNICNHALDVLSNCLCVTFISNKTHLVVWLMKEYGVVESWTKLMVIPHCKFWNPRWLPSFDPLCISENGVILLKMCYYSKLILYDPNNDRLNYPKILSKLGLENHIYHETLVSPRF